MAYGMSQFFHKYLIELNLRIFKARKKNFTVSFQDGCQANIS